MTRTTLIVSLFALASGAYASTISTFNISTTAGLQAGDPCSMSGAGPASDLRPDHPGRRGRRPGDRAACVLGHREEEGRPGRARKRLAAPFRRPHELLLESDLACPRIADAPSPRCTGLSRRFGRLADPFRVTRDCGLDRRRDKRGSPIGEHRRPLPPAVGGGRVCRQLLALIPVRPDQPHGHRRGPAHPLADSCDGIGPRGGRAPRSSRGRKVRRDATRV